MDAPEASNNSEDASYNRGLIAWFARNHVAANLLLVFICVLGFFSISVLKKETFPTFALDMIEIGVAILEPALKKSKRAFLSRSKKRSPPFRVSRS